LLPREPRGSQKRSSPRSVIAQAIDKSHNTYRVSNGTPHANEVGHESGKQLRKSANELFKSANELLKKGNRLLKVQTDFSKAETDFSKSETNSSRVQTGF